MEHLHTQAIVPVPERGRRIEGMRLFPACRGEDALGEFVRHKIRLADHQGVAQGILVEGLSRQHRFRRIPYPLQREHSVLIAAFGGIPFLRQHLDRI